MLFYPATLSLSSRTLIYVAGIIRRHRSQIGSAWRKLTADRQALLVLAYLRKGETLAGPGSRDDHQQRLRCSQGVVRGGVEPPTFRFSGAFAASLHVAGRGLTGHLAAQTMAGCRLAWPDICGRLAPRLAPLGAGGPDLPLG